MRTLAGVALTLGLVAGCGAADPGETPRQSAAAGGASPGVSTGPAEPTDQPEPSEPPEPTQAPRPSQPAYPMSPALQADDALIEPVLHGGCASVMYLGENVAADSCGPTSLDGAITAEAVEIAPDAPLSIIAQDGWRVGADQSLVGAGRDGMRWHVRAGATEGLAGTDETGLVIPYDIGPELAGGVAPIRVIELRAPSAPGDYLLQLAGPLTRDGWTFTESTWYWHLRVR